MRKGLDPRAEMQHVIMFREQLLHLKEWRNIYVDDPWVAKLRG